MAKKSKIQINLEYYAVWAILSFLGALPRKLALFISLRLVDIAFPFLGRLKRVALINLGIAFPDMSENERKKLIRGCFNNLGRQLAEISQFPKASRENLKKLVEFPISDADWTKYRKLKEEGRGVIYLTPHFGGWEVLAFSSSAFIGPQSYLVRKLDNPRLEEMLSRLRGKFGNQPIDKSNAILPALNLLRNGGDLGILPDLNSQKNEGIFVPFFGKPACTTSGVAALVMRTNALVVVLGAVWDEKKDKYVVDLGAVLEFESGGKRSEDLVNFTAKFTKEIENLIRRNPEQWFWIHKRWKTQPDGIPDLYKVNIET